MKKLLTIDQAADYLHTPPDLFGHFVEKGVVPCLDLTTGRYFLTEELDQWVVARGLYRDPSLCHATLASRYKQGGNENWTGWSVPEKLKASPADLPACVGQGRFCFMRFDGGFLEEEKARISRWDLLALDKNGMHNLGRIYTEELAAMLGHLRGININWVWITWSNGFSLQHESRQFQQCRTVIEKCHQAGIRVSAYMSCNNIFWEEMESKEPDSKDWVLVEGGVKLTYENMPPRRLANLRHPAWLKYTQQRMRLAVEAGIDGFFFDNCEAPTEDLMFFLPGIRRFLREELKSSALLELNLHVYHRPHNIPLEDLCDVVYNEWGFAVPGVDEKGDWNVTNIRTPIRYVSGHLPPRKPTKYELPRRHNHIFPSRTQKLFSYEAAAFGTSVHRYIEGYTTTGLLHKDPAVLEAWEAIGQADRFILNNSGLYCETESAATIGILVYGPTWEEAFLDMLTRANLFYDILEIRALPRIDLARYKLLLVPGCPAPDKKMVEILPGFRKAGGKVAVITNSDLFAPWSDVNWPVSLLEEAGSDLECARKFGRELSNIAGALQVKLSETYVLASLRKKTDGSGWLLHLINYDSKPAENISVKLTLPGNISRPASPKLFSPDIIPPALENIVTDGRLVNFNITVLDQYAVVVIPGTDSSDFG